MPPSPTISIGPNCGSRKPPTTTSRPAGIISSTSQPSIFAAAMSGFFAIAATAAPTASGVARPSATPPASDLCRMSGDTTLTTKGPSKARAAFSAPGASGATTERGVRMP